MYINTINQTGVTCQFFMVRATIPIYPYRLLRQFSLINKYYNYQFAISSETCPHESGEQESVTNIKHMDSS